MSADGIRRRLQVSESHGDPARVVLGVCGELDVDTVLVLARAVAGVIFREPTPEVLVLDLTGLSFATAAGLRILHTAQNHAAVKNVVVRVVPGPLPAVTEVLRSTGLAAVLDLYPTRFEALTAATLPPFLAEAEARWSGA